MLDVLIISHALVDETISVSEEELVAHGLNKGEYHFGKSVLPGAPEERHAGGTGTNTALSLAALGVSVNFFSRIGNDTDGEFLQNELQKYGVHAYPTVGGKTGKCQVLVTPDGERTHVTNLHDGGKIHSPASVEKIVYTTGFEINTNKENLTKYLRAVRKMTCSVAIDLAEPRTAKEIRDSLYFIKPRIIFASEQEYVAAFGHGPKQPKYGALYLKSGELGSKVLTKDSIHEIAPNDINVTNLNGAGDAYAAGVLSSLANGEDYVQAGYKGREVAEMIIGQTPPYIQLENIVDTDRRYVSVAGVRK